MISLKILLSPNNALRINDRVRNAVLLPEGQLPEQVPQFIQERIISNPDLSNLSWRPFKADFDKLDMQFDNYVEVDLFEAAPNSNSYAFLISSRGASCSIGYPLPNLKP